MVFWKNLIRGHAARARAVEAFEVMHGFLWVKEDVVVEMSFDLLPFGIHRVVM